MAKRIFVFLVMFLPSLAVSLSAYAGEVLMIMWAGKLPSEVGFEKKLKALRPDVKIKYIDAERSKSKLAQALRNTDLSSVDVIYTFGTNTARLVQDYNKGKRPHVFNIVSTPVLSGIVDSMDKPGKNTTGAALMISIQQQLEIMHKLKKIKSVAVWFDPREKQSKILLEQVKSKAKELGITPKPFRIIPDAKNIDKLIDEASKETNELDGMLLVGSASIHQHSKKIMAKLSPSLFVMSNAEKFARTGATVAIAPTFTERGEAAAELAHKILGGEQAGNLPVSLVTQKNAWLFVNKSRADSAGLKGYDKIGYRVKVVE